MCGRYTLHQKVQSLKEHYNVKHVPHGLKENYNVAPGQFMPVVTSGDGKPELDVMKWGLVPAWAKDPKIGYKLINARDDTIFNKPVWRNIILRQRCLIPADGFYEWQKITVASKEQKQPFYIKPKQADLFSFAGVWETRKDAEGLELKTYSIITTSPNKEMKTIHNRMPVILHQEDYTSWLEPPTQIKENLEYFLRPYEDDGLEMYEVSRDVNAVRNNNIKLIYPIDYQ